MRTSCYALKIVLCLCIVGLAGLVSAADIKKDTISKTSSKSSIQTTPAKKKKISKPKRISAAAVDLSVERI